MSSSNSFCKVATLEKALKEKVKYGPVVFWASGFPVATSPTNIVIQFTLKLIKYWTFCGGGGGR